MSGTSLSVVIDGLFLGQVENRWEGRAPSAIRKRVADGKRRIEAHGFLDDAQADLENHGGAEKAIHHYPTDHYEPWMAEGAVPAGTIPAAFGENLATVGITEDTICIGDILRLGTAVVQVSQGRQPCWKVAKHTQNPRMAYLFQKTGRTGWYYRVLEPGDAGQGDAITLLDRLQPDWTVRHVTYVRLSRRAPQAEVEVLAELSELAMDWREAFAKMAQGDRDEDTSRRLDGLSQFDD